MSAVRTRHVLPFIIMNVNPLFSSFVATSNLDADNNMLTNFAYWLTHQSSGVLLSNEGGFQSDSITKVPQLKPFVDMLEEQANILHKKVGLNDKYKQIVANMWININGYAHHNKVHLHPGACFSGVYYVKAEEYAGCIEFLTPVTSFYHTMPADALEDECQYNSDTHLEVPVAGKLVMFPSWLMHFTQPNLSKSERISIAFNTVLHEKNDSVEDNYRIAPGDSQK
jgi:uncharacterized protein (TIGR02466 family)